MYARLATSAFLAVILSLSCGQPEPHDVEREAKAQLGGGFVQFFKIHSEHGGEEFANLTRMTARPHGGAFEFFYTDQSAGGLNTSANFNGTPLQNDETTEPRVDVFRRRWVCPPHLRGLSGLFTIAANGMTASYSIVGSGATCFGACGRMAASGCWCDDACMSYGDCCADKAPVCGANWPLKCSCASDCGTHGDLCCQPSQCPIIGM
jgi:hypothetical protein